MAKIVVVTSGKGGVGKTTTSASFATGLALYGYKTVVVDFDVGLRNLDLMMGCERRVLYNFIDVINGHATLQQALIQDKTLENLYILPTSQTQDKDALTNEGVERVLGQLTQYFDYIVCDSPAGIERGAFLAMYYADEAIIVVNPEIASVRDADRMIGMIDSKCKKVRDGRGEIPKHLCITRYNAVRAESGEILSINDISKDILRIPTLGVIPDCPYVARASNAGKPVILFEDAKSGQCYGDLVGRFLGEERPYRYTTPEAQFSQQNSKTTKKKGFWAKLFGG